MKTKEELNVYYYTNESGSCEIDFVVDTGEEIIPLEVKAEENLRAKSLRIYHEKYKPALSVRTSMSDYRRQDWMVNLPLCAIETFPGVQRSGISFRGQDICCAAWAYPGGRAK